MTFFANSISQTCIPISSNITRIELPTAVASRSREPSLRVDSAVMDRPTSSDSLVAGIIASLIRRSSCHVFPLIHCDIADARKNAGPSLRSVGYMGILYLYSNGLPLHIQPLGRNYVTYLSRVHSTVWVGLPQHRVSFPSDLCCLHISFPRSQMLPILKEGLRKWRLSRSYKTSYTGNVLLQYQ